MTQGTVRSAKRDALPSIDANRRSGWGIFHRMPSKRGDPSWLSPGDTAPHCGVYRVYHYAHRAPHEVSIEKGAVLPECRVCGTRVQFAPMVIGTRLADDRDLHSDGDEDGKAA